MIAIILKQGEHVEVHKMQLVFLFITILLAIILARECESELHLLFIKKKKIKGERDIDCVYFKE